MLVDFNYGDIYVVRIIELSTELFVTRVCHDVCALILATGIIHRDVRAPIVATGTIHRDVRALILATTTIDRDTHTSFPPAILTQWPANTLWKLLR
jgi:hypothetical protein